MVSAECAESDEQIKGLLVASFEMNTLLKFYKNKTIRLLERLLTHGDHAGVALGVGSSFEFILNRFRYSLVFGEVLNGHSRAALLGVFELNAESVGKLLLHLGGEVKLEVDSNSILVSLEDPEALVLSVVDLAGFE